MQVSRVMPHNPDLTVERSGSLYRIVRKVGPHETVDGLKKMLKDGEIELYSQHGDEVIIYAPSEKAAETIADLPIVRQPSKILEKAKEIFLPPNMSENVAPEYLKFRAWSLGAAVAAGAVSFSNVAVSLDAVKQSFSTTEKAALAQTINTFIWRFAYMGGSFLATKGEEDPRRFYMTSSLISSTNSLATLGVLSMIPKAYMPLAVTTNLIGAVGSTLGGASSVNIFNHLAINNKAVVQSKNSNQDMVASMLGMPLALGIKKASLQLGMNPAIVTAATMGPVILFCSLQAASAIRMEPVNRTQLQQMADRFLDKGDLPEAPTHGWLDTLKSVFGMGGTKADFSQNVVIASHLDEVVAPGDAPENLFSVFKDDRYLLSYDPKESKIHLAFRKDARLQDLFHAYCHARLLEEAAPRMYTDVEKLCGKDAPNAFVELTHRALSAPFEAGKELREHGWHDNALKLHFPTLDSAWSGPALNPLPPVTREEFLQLLAHPDEAKLQSLLGKSANEAPNNASPEPG